MPSHVRGWPLLLLVSALGMVFAELPPLPGWEVVFMEEFNGDMLNSSLWHARNNESHCCPAELQLYLARNLVVANGTLTIFTEREDVMGPSGVKYNFTSGWIDTDGTFAWTYGLWEVHAQLPAQSATGAWPAHWMMPASHPCWPTGGEIDVMEQTSTPFGNFSTASLRWGTECDDDKQLLPGGLYFGNGSGFDATQWHTYQALWTPKYLAFGVDGNVFENVTSNNVPIPESPFYWILNTAVAWYWPPSPSAVYPTTHVIDWIRVTAPK